MQFDLQLNPNANLTNPRQLSELVKPELKANIFATIRKERKVPLYLRLNITNTSTSASAAFKFGDPDNSNATTSASSISVSTNFKLGYANLNGTFLRYCRVMSLGFTLTVSDEAIFNTINLTTVTYDFENARQETDIQSAVEGATNVASYDPKVRFVVFPTIQYQNFGITGQLPASGTVQFLFNVDAIDNY